MIATVTDRPAEAPTTPNPDQSDGILFDQYSRYACCAESVRALLPDGGTVLDVGSGKPRLLGRFLPGVTVTYVDPGLEEDADDAIQGDVFATQLDGAEFDVVTCVDTLEHVPPDVRDRFLDRLQSLARRGLVLAAPFADGGGAASVDDHVNRVFEAHTGRDYPWLHEHQEYGLPDLTTTEARVRDTHGWQLTRFGNGRIEWLDALLVPHVLNLGSTHHTAFFREVGKCFADLAYEYDHLPPVYRQVLVAWRGPSPTLPERRDDHDTRAAAERAWTRFRDEYERLLANHLGELVNEAAELRAKLQHVHAVSRKRLDFLEAEVARLREQAQDSTDA